MDLDGTLLRLPAGDPAWADDLPPAPPGCEVSVSFTTRPSSRLARTLTALGYRLVDASDVRLPPQEHRTADFLVDRATSTAHPTWWGMLTARASRGYRVTHGPVVLAFGPLLDAHLAARGRASAQ